MRYEHTQPGWVFRIVIGLFYLIWLASLSGIFFADRELFSGILIPIVISSVVLVLFHSLRVCIDSETLLASFGIGLIRFTFLLEEIEECAPVRSRFYNGWGIRKIRHGWLLNVSGYDTVQIKLRSGKIYRIGTDDQDGLMAALETAIGQVNPPAESVD